MYETAQKADACIPISKGTPRVLMEALLKSLIDGRDTRMVNEYYMSVQHQRVKKQR